MTGRVLMNPELLKHVGLFPLPQVALLPCQLMPLHVFEPRYRQLVEDTLQHHRLIAVPRLVPGYEANYHGTPELVKICGVGQIVQHELLPDGRYNVLLRGIGRIRLLEEVSSIPYRIARAEAVEDIASSIVSHDSLHQEVRRLGSILLGRLQEPELALISSAFQAAAAMGDQSPYLAGAFVDDLSERQILLEERDPVKRLLHLHELLQLRVDSEVESWAKDPENLN